MPLIYCEINLILTWSQNYFLTDVITEASDPNANPAVTDVNAPKEVTFKIKETKLYAPVVTFSTQDDNKLLEKLETEFKRTIKWNKYRSQITNQTKNNNLNYLIDPTFTKVNRLFVLSFKNEGDRTSFSMY